MTPIEKCPFPKELEGRQTWSAFEYAFLARDCGCNDHSEPDLYECDECGPVLEAVWRRSNDGPDRTDPGYWLDNR